MWLYTLKIPGFGKRELHVDSAKMITQAKVRMRIVFIYISCSCV